MALTTFATPAAPPLLVTARPRQWIKNVLVFAAPLAAGVLVRPGSLVALAAFILASAGTYFVNDASDVAADRRHPVKSRRPVAAGLVPVRTAWLIGLGLSAAAPLVAALAGPATAGCVAAYLALTFAYSSGLKRIAVLDILAVAGGFLLRTIGGAYAARVPMSSWFLLTALLGSLFLVTGKRLSELRRDGTGRAVLAGYSTSWLQQTMTMTLTGAVLAYAGWAFDFAGDDSSLPLLGLSLVPFLAALMRYSLLVSRGDGEAPENLLVSDRFLLVAGFAWAVLVTVAIYFG
ncbi:decaprenyl-phosphate phosphoribosyltransferase [Actinoplanes sp. L3-i22]|uniref:decaprenyl-phosphate phosphoribosyltransferase n=1 Tax=Actinoplanes sp. L3-i22 TaxID=2836373 RepID=UPI001C765C1C|nr:decaprenyl-phosphate phosphoribosyltransferase [Actinoplanes sp. L3-i22]BCY11599.1 decaprenyl-phosphate phosphoribosyltransferase [Actinoplanes sp. L3-i22]